MLTRKLKVTERYLILPVSRRPGRGAGNEHPQFTGHMRLIVDGNVIRHFDIDLSESPGDYQVFSDLSDYQNRILTLEFDGPSSKSVENIYLSDIPTPNEEPYSEKLRPQFHFSSLRGWNNDPNGLFYLDGEYHLLYQHNPYSVEWGNLHWGHAVSSDLVHWKELPVALYPDELGAMSTGSSVVDYDNTSGLGSQKTPAVVAIYTAGHAAWTPGFVQCLAFSTDKGRTWSKYSNNPVIQNIINRNRDPKVIWHQKTERWVMVLYLDGNDYSIFTSPNLLDWTRESDLRIPRATECPELFPLNLFDNETDSKLEKWVLWAANSTYLVGSFDGKTFKPEQTARKLQPIGDAYAGQTWDNLPQSDGRRIQISWLRQVMPGMPFGQTMTIPHSLSLERRNHDSVLVANPVEELRMLRVKSWNIFERQLSSQKSIEAEITGELLDIELDIDLKTADCFELLVRGTSLFYDQRLGALCCGNYTVCPPELNGQMLLRVLADRTSIELYTDQGALTMAVGVILPSWNHSIVLSIHGGGNAFIKRFEVHKLNTALPFQQKP